MNPVEKGCLYIVATPIGNLDDITYRAVQVLKEVDAIAAEDTRHSKKLMQHLGVTTPLFALHEHNENALAEKIIKRLERGESLALISDAGTPLISDPGFPLVNQAHKAGLKIIPVPGASSVLAALSVSGLPTDRFVFEGFLPSKKTARQNRLRELEKETRTLILFETPHRIAVALADLAEVLGEDREIVIARELTKTHEEVKRSSVGQLLEAANSGALQERGEFVLVLAGNGNKKSAIDDQALKIFDLLL
ncbi:MAG: 16S rRNA (cytidine(1402)-2'-O)-methyltransferase, partial [Gammaproteobacteria bacterium]